MGFDQMHMRHCILYEFKKGSKASQAARNIRSVYKNEAPSIRTCQRWFKQFESENFTLEDSLRSGRPSSVPLKVLNAVVKENPKQTARELAKQFSTCHRTKFGYSGPRFYRQIEYFLLFGMLLSLFKLL